MTSIVPLTANDYVELMQLYARYASCLDLGDGEGRAATFVPDATFCSHVNHRKLDDVDTLRLRTNANGNNGTRHIQYNHTFEATAEGANGTVFLLFLTRLDDPVVSATFGMYRDKLVRTSDGWRFKSREHWHDTDPDNPFKYKPRIVQGVKT